MKRIWGLETSVEASPHDLGADERGVEVADGAGLRSRARTVRGCWSQPIDYLTGGGRTGLSAETSPACTDVAPGAERDP